MVHKNNIRFTTEMKSGNESFVVDFILLGFSNFPQLQGQLFWVFLADYLVTLLGNAIIIVVISLEQSLHVPMYLFLLNLSVVEVSFSAVIMPEMLVVLCSEKTTITFAGCFAQMYFILLFGGTECFLLGAMAYNRFGCNLPSSELSSDYEQKGFHEISNVLMGLMDHGGYCADHMGV